MFGHPFMVQGIGTVSEAMNGIPNIGIGAMNRMLTVIPALIRKAGPCSLARILVLKAKGISGADAGPPPV